MDERSSVFDMIGPVMIGPSSSHTAGVVKIARVAVKVLGSIPETSVITFFNSFARTYEGHSSDRAIIAGLLDFKPDDKRIKNAFYHAEKRKLTFSFKSVGNASTMHPNTIKLELTLKDRKVVLIGESRGGGVIKIVNVDGFTSNFTADLHTLIIKSDDAKGSIAYITSVISHDDGNIATMSVSRKGKHDDACQFIEIDTPIKEATLNYIKSLSWIHEIVYIPKMN